jgi:hypothetical protein
MAGLSANSNLEGGNQPSYKENPIAILKISWCRTKKKQKTDHRKARKHLQERQSNESVFVK